MFVPGDTYSVGAWYGPLGTLAGVLFSEPEDRLALVVRSAVWMLKAHAQLSCVAARDCVASSGSGCFEGGWVAAPSLVEFDEAGAVSEQQILNRSLTLRVWLRVGSAANVDQGLFASAPMNCDYSFDSILVLDRLSRRTEHATDPVGLLGDGLDDGQEHGFGLGQRELAVRTFDFGAERVHQAPPKNGLQQPSVLIEPVKMVHLSAWRLA